MQLLEFRRLRIQRARICRQFTGFHLESYRHSLALKRQGRDGINMAQTGAEGGAEAMCRMFRSNGKCRFGESCKFQHVDGPTDSPNGECFIFADSGGTCKFGDECRYRHGPSDTRELPPPKQASASSEEKSDQPCGQLMRGKCRYGKRCWGKCRYGKGKCRYGKRCRFSHTLTPEQKAQAAEQRKARQAARPPKEHKGDDNNNKKQNKETPGSGPAPTDGGSGDKNGEDGAGGERRRRRRRPKGAKKGAAKNGGDAPADKTTPSGKDGGDNKQKEKQKDGEEGSGGRRRRRKDLCHQWKDSQSCEYAEKCRFLHGEDDSRDLMALRRSPNACWSFRDENNCQYGDKCRFSHSTDAPDDRDENGNKDGQNA
eukprot:g11604.t1